MTVFLRRLRIVGRISIVLREFIKQPLFGKWLQIRFKRMSLVAVIHFVAVELEGKCPHVLSLFDRIFDRIFCPMIERILVDAFDLRRFAISRKGIVLAY